MPPRPKKDRPLAALSKWPKTGVFSGRFRLNVIINQWAQGSKIAQKLTLLPILPYRVRRVSTPWSVLGHAWNRRSIRPLIELWSTVCRASSDRG
jgi:hypothetical protein